MQILALQKAINLSSDKDLKNRLYESCQFALKERHWQLNADGA